MADKTKGNDYKISRTGFESPLSRQKTPTTGTFWSAATILIKRKIFHRSIFALSLSGDPTSNKHINTYFRNKKCDENKTKTS